MMAIGRRLVTLMLATILAATIPGAVRAGAFASDRITVVTRGEGDNVILIPGLSSSPRVWTDMIKAVPGHRYHLVQVSGFAGQPAGGNAEGPIAAPVAEEIARYIAETGLAKPAVIGHSMGGTIGLMLAARHPDAVGRLMVVDTLPFLGAVFGPPGTTSESITPLADDIMKKMLAADPEARRKQAEATVAAMIDTAAMRPDVMEDMLASDSGVAARAFRELIVTDLRPELGNIIAPTTVLYVNPKNAHLDDDAIDATYKNAYEPLQNVELVQIQDSAHFIMLDRPERFHEEVTDFLG